MSDNYEGYRLGSADLDRIINEVKSATDLSDAVKDLFLAHYELEEMAELKTKLVELQIELARLRPYTRHLTSCAKAVADALADILNLTDEEYVEQYGIAKCTCGLERI